MKKTLLAGLSRASFMRRHWQKEPLISRAALSEYADAITREDLFALAMRDDVESRIVAKSRGGWTVRHGPFTARDLERLPRTSWTLLVQSVDSHLRQAARLLSEFSFLPYARLDDVMVSYAAPGGGVGAHFDSYDVFLVQGSGERRWQVSRQRDLALVPDAPLKILRRFAPEMEWTVEAGDVLYLPPNCAHDGVAVGECMTYSVGFRAPGARELAQHFMQFLEDNRSLEAMYSDPDLAPTAHPGRIPSVMIERIATLLETLRWSPRDVAEFAGRYLSEPKPGVVFDTHDASRTRFVQRARRRGVELALATRMLVHGRDVYINGERHHVGGAALRQLGDLADNRRLAPPLRVAPDAEAILYDWYTAGYIEIA